TALNNNGGHFDAQAAFPAAAMPPLPLAPALASGGAPVTVGVNQTITLDPGTYGALSVQGTLLLYPGRYVFARATLTDFAHIEAVEDSDDQGGPPHNPPRIGSVDIRIGDTLTAGRCVTIRPANHKTADHLTISVAGSDGTGGQPAAALGEHSLIRAML